MSKNGLNVFEISYQRVKNLGDYETERFEAKVKVNENEDPAKKFKALKKFVCEKLDIDEDESSDDDYDEDDFMDFDDDDF